MKRHKGVIIFAVAIFLLMLLSTVSYTAEQNKDICVITTFGKITGVVDGRKNPGLHFKLPWPIQKNVKLDSRIQTTQTAFNQFTIGNKRNILCSVYCNWRIVDAEKFYRSKNSIKGVKESLQALLSNAMKSKMASFDLTEIVNTDPSKMKITEIEKLIRSSATELKTGKVNEYDSSLAKEALDSYGVEIIAVGIDRLGLPATATETIITAMINERQGEINKSKSEGEAIGSTIEANGARSEKMIMSAAKARAKTIESDADTASKKYINEFTRNKELAQYLIFMQGLEAQLKDNTQFILDRDWLISMYNGFIDQSKKNNTNPKPAK